MHACRFRSFYRLTAGTASCGNNWLGMDLLDIEEKRRNQNRLSRSQVRTHETKVRIGIVAHRVNETTQISNLPSDVARDYLVKRLVRILVNVTD